MSSRYMHVQPGWGAGGAGGAGGRVQGPELPQLETQNSDSITEATSI